MKFRILSLLLACCYLSMSSAQTLWTHVESDQIPQVKFENSLILPNHFQALKLDQEGLKKLLWKAPMERTSESLNNALRIPLPMPDGTYQEFELSESPIMHSDLSAKYPGIKTFAGRGIDHPEYTLRVAFTHLGAHVIIHELSKIIYIEPHSRNQDVYYMSYYSSDHPDNISDLTHWNHEHVLEYENKFGAYQSANKNMGPVDLYNYRFAVACSGEYTQSFGSVANALSAVVNVTNIINSVLERDAAVRFTLVPNQEDIIWLDPTTDPFTNGGTSGILLPQAHNAIVNNIGLDNFDTGHLFTTSCSGGIAGVTGGRICNPSGKGRILTCRYPNNFGGFAGTALHEIGHHLSAGHTWNNCPTLPPDLINSQYSASTAWEPGSGSTLMSYSGACGSANNIGADDDYLHSGSIEEMMFFTRDVVSCGEVISTNNNMPEAEIDLQDGFYIPISTPFRLTGMASDPDGDNMTYNWEQFDLGPQGDLGQPTGNAPIFRSIPPSGNLTRWFPKIVNVINSIPDRTEVLPTYSRDLTFRFTVRDNNPEVGGVTWDEVEFEATEQAGPFVVTYPDFSETWAVNEQVDITWDVANTDNAAHVNCQFVDIYLSTNGGYTYPVMIAEGVPNDGSETIFVPDVTTTAGRIMVAASDNVFYDINNYNITIQSPNEPGFSYNLSPNFQELCIPEVASIEIETGTILGFDEPINLDVVDGLPAGATYSFSQNPVPPGEMTTLEVDFSNVTENGTFAITIEAYAMNTDTVNRIFNIKAIRSDFSAFQILDPPNGLTDAPTFSIFTWLEVADATGYDFQMGTDPSFQTGILFNESNLGGNTFSPPLSFNEKTLYFWRMRPKNNCGNGSWSEPFAFHTLLLSCSMAENLEEFNIPQAGTPEIESKITIANGGTVSDINIPNMKGSHTYISDLEATLISPAGTEVTLFKNKCFNLTNFDIGFDDQAPNGIPCPMTDGGSHTPQQSLDAFNGESSVGDWTLRIKDNVSGSGGKLERWDVEICGGFSVSNPYLVNNDTLKMGIAEKANIRTADLLVQDDDQGPEDLTVTIVTLPEHGTLRWWNQNLKVGDRFPFKAVNDLGFSYEHDGGTGMNDQFKFVVTDGEGGWLSITQFNILVSDLFTGIGQLSIYERLDIAPNPASQSIQISYAMKTADASAVHVELMTIDGKILNRIIGDRVEDSVQMDLSGIASGMYFVRLISQQGMVVEKIAIQK